MEDDGRVSFLSIDRLTEIWGFDRCGLQSRDGDRSRGGQSVGSPQAIRGL